MIKNYLKNDKELRDFVKECRAHYKLRGSSWKVPDISAPPTFFAPSAWPLWTMIRYADGCALGSLHSGGPLQDEFRKLFREHLQTLFPTVTVTFLMEEELKLVRLFYAVSCVAIDVYELNRTPLAFTEVVFEHLRQITNHLETLVLPLLKKMPTNSAFEKAREKHARRTVLGLHSTAKSSDSSDSSSSDDDDPSMPSKKSRTEKEVNKIAPASTGAKPTTPLKKNRNQRRSEVMKRIQKGFAAFNQTLGAPSATSEVINENNSATATATANEAETHEAVADTSAPTNDDVADVRSPIREVTVASSPNRGGRSNGASSPGRGSGAGSPQGRGKSQGRSSSQGRGRGQGKGRGKGRQKSSPKRRRRW